MLVEEFWYQGNKADKGKSWASNMIFLLSVHDFSPSSPGGSVGKESTCYVGDLSSKPGLGRSSGAGHGNPLRYSFLENPHGPRSLMGYSPWNSPGQNTEVGSLSLLQGIFLVQGSNPGFPHCRQILYQLSHKGSPRVLEWVKVKLLSGVRLCDPMDSSLHQAPPSMGFSRQEYWSGLP